MSPLGQYLGGTFNFVFFMLSALLIGQSIKKRKSLRGRLSENSVTAFFKARIMRKTRIFSFSLPWNPRNPRLKYIIMQARSEFSDSLGG